MIYNLNITKMLFIQTRERRESPRALIIIFPAELMHGMNPLLLSSFG